MYRNPPLFTINWSEHLPPKLIADRRMYKESEEDEVMEKSKAFWMYFSIIEIS